MVINKRGIIKSFADNGWCQLELLSFENSRDNLRPEEREEVTPSWTHGPCDSDRLLFGRHEGVTPETWKVGNDLSEERVCVSAGFIRGL